LAIARRGAELLDEKYRALLRERLRLRPLVAVARGDWDEQAREAERWLLRTALLGGERPLHLFRTLAGPTAHVEVAWHRILGVSCPTEARLTSSPKPEQSPPSAGAAVICAAQAHRRALDAAVRLAVLQGALTRIETELRATALRRNAIERRWIPAHEAALAALEMTLEELEREDGARVRLLTAAERP
jgi:V/A-type H+-transporting ATPase subunit D